MDLEHAKFVQLDKYGNGISVDLALVLARASTSRSFLMKMLGVWFDTRTQYKHGTRLPVFLDLIENNVFLQWALVVGSLIFIIFPKFFIKNS